MKRIDLNGKRFGRLLVTGSAETKGRYVFWPVRCDCGVQKKTNASSLLHKNVISCGCFAREVIRERSTTHGHAVNRSPTKEYKAWLHAKERCNNPNCERYPHYGGRGISMDQEWAENFGAFFRDMGKCPKGKTLDRIRVDGNYEPSNCRWATQYQQSRNRTDNVIIAFEGKNWIMADLASHLKIDKRRFHLLYRKQKIPLAKILERYAWRTLIQQ